MNEIIKLIEADFPDHIWLVRNFKPGRYFAHVYRQNETARVEESHRAYASRPTEALTLAYRRALEAKHTEPSNAN